MQAIVLHSIDDCQHPFAKQARVQHNDNAYHDTIEDEDPMVPHILEAPNCPVFVNICVTPVSSTVDAVLVVNFDVGIRPLISP